MKQTLVEKILSGHAGKTLKAGEIANITLDARVARDFGGANVVEHIEKKNLGIDDPSRTFFTFDCNPGGSDQKYATNQHRCRLFARERNIRIFDITAGIGTHVAIEQGLVSPGGTLVSTDSHANILGAIGVFGQGMGDQDIAAAFAQGQVWFQVPRSMKVILKGRLPESATPKDLILHLVKNFGASGMLGYAAEITGEAADALSLDARITVSSMATEMAGIIALFTPSSAIIDFCSSVSGKRLEPVAADPGASYEKEIEVDISGVEPLIARPGHPDDVVPVSRVEGQKIDSAFIGSCTNGRYEDMAQAADILKERRVAPGVVLKIVPSTRQVWKKCLDTGILDVFTRAGALVGNPGCAGCAAGQIGQNGPGEITVSTGNRNFPGKQGRGKVYLASPATAAASAVAGVIARAQAIPEKPALFSSAAPAKRASKPRGTSGDTEQKPVELTGRIWLVRQNNIDTDMIFHNRYLTITDPREMGQYTFDNLEGWEDFSKKAKPGDIVITGSNFGAGSSRQQAVDCFKSLGIQAIIAMSFGAIYERNAINAGLPVIRAGLLDSELKDGDEIRVNLSTGVIRQIKNGDTWQGEPFSSIQMEIYQRGGLLC
jgi:3-isopropylmalate dehydratase small subunit